MTTMTTDRLTATTDRLDAIAARNIGYPVATDTDYTDVLLPFINGRRFLNNIGDPNTDPTFPGHAKDLEREVITYLAALFHAPTGSFGYVTSGGTESTLYGLSEARDRHPGAVVYHSTAAHYSVAKAANLLGLPRVPIRTCHDTDEIDYNDLIANARLYTGRPAIVVATIGTTMTEDIDDVARIRQALTIAGVPTHRVYVHADAALSGIPLALNHRTKTAFDLRAADSISVSGHKFLGTPLACGAVITRTPATTATAVDYIGAADTTITGSRSGIHAVMLWHAITHHGTDGLRRRAAHARWTAAEAAVKLTAIGWPHRRNRLAMTVVMQPLPEPLRARWPLPISNGRTHIITMPGVTMDSVNELITDLAPYA